MKNPNLFLNNPKKYRKDMIKYFIKNRKEFADYRNE
jgi:hypothetical protein